MAKPPKLIVDAEEHWKIRGSFPSGRYRFSLKSGAVSLLTDDLGYGENDTIPWRLFRILVFTGDAWLPNQNDGQVETGNDLSRPTEAVELPKRDARVLADHLRRRRFGDDVRDALAEEIESTFLGQFMDSDDLRGKEEWVEDMAQLVESRDVDADSTEPMDESAESVRLLHIGRVTLGRRNMGRSARIDDYHRAFRHAIETAIERDVTAVVQTGGLFQSRSPSSTTVESCRRELVRLRDHDISFYLVFGRQEAEAKTDHLTHLANDGLVEPIGGRSVTLGDAVVLHGIDAGETAKRARQSRDGPEEASFIAYAVGDANANSPHGAPFEAVAANAPTVPNVYLTGRRTDPAWSKRDGVPIVDPGATENVLSKTTFGEDPVERGVYEYTITDGSFSVRRHDIPVRPFETFRFEVDADADLTAIERQVAGSELSGKAVLGLLEGEMSPQAVTRKEVQQYLADRSHCARVWDERSVVEQSGSNPASETHDRFGGVPVADESASYLDTLDAVEDLDLEALPQDELVDLYVLSSKVRSVAEDVRKATRDHLVERVPEGEAAAGAFGSVESHRRESRRLKNESDVLEALEEGGISRETVLTQKLDQQKVEEVLNGSHHTVQEEDLYELSESRYVTRNELDVDALDTHETASPDS